MTGRQIVRALVALGLATAASEPITAQVRGDRNRGGGRFFGGNMPGYQYNVPYSGRYTFVRIRYEGYYKMQQEGPGWAHDYPIAESNFLKILEEITILKPFMEGSNILDLKDPDLFKYPVAYMSEPGGWEPSEEDITALREYLLKGGFLVFDDFPGEAYNNTIYQMKRVLPKGEVVPLTMDHPIFDSFFRIQDARNLQGGYGTPEFLGIYEDNDPKKRLMAVLTLYGDLGENWEFSDQGFLPITSTNEAYKLGINYLIYAMTR
jgi:hypothetical protein